MKHYSPSQINMYLRCSMQWAYRYIHELKIPPSSALVQGSSYHKAMEFNLSQKIESKKDLPLEEVKASYSDQFDNLITEVDWNDEEKSQGIDKVKGSLKDEGIKITETAHTVFNPQIYPKEVESPFKISFDNTDYTLDGVIDVVDINNIVIDHKTTGKTPSTISQQEIIQGAIYSIAKNTNQVMFNYVIKNKKQIHNLLGNSEFPSKTVSLTKNIDNSDKEYVLRLVSAIDAAVNKELFYPNRASMMCSKKNCGYWAQCEKDWGGKVK